MKIMSQQTAKMLSPNLNCRRVVNVLLQEQELHQTKEKGRLKKNEKKKKNTFANV